MPHIPETTDPQDWHRYFAMEYNNRAWTLVAQPTRTAAEDDEMLNAAHASTQHWNEIGTELNHMRAKMLLAEVHAQLGLGASAFAYADEMHTFFLGRETPDWEVAFTHTIHAHAAHAVGKPTLHHESYERAVQAIDAIQEDKDRQIVLATFNKVPKPK